MIATLLFLAALLLPSVAHAQTWPNEPSGATVLADCNFNTPTCGVFVDEFGNGQVVSDATAPFSPTSVLHQIMPGTSTSGGAQIWRIFSPALNEIYLAYWFNTNSGFMGFPSSINKLGFVNTDFPGGVWYFGLYGNSGGPFTLYFETNTTSVDNSHLPNSFGGLIHFGNSCQVVRGRWYRLEAYFKTSDDATSQDGIFRWWLTESGGTPSLCGNYHNANMPGSINYVDINHTWDGGTPNTGWKTGDWYHHFDHLHVSTGGSSGGPDTTPPNPVTGITVE